MTYSFKIFGAQAAEMLSEIHRLSFQDDSQQIWSPEAMETLLQGPDTHVMVVSQQQQPIGFLMWRRMIDEAEILTICILPIHRAKGAASQLLQQFYRNTKENGIRHIFLEVNENNRAALKLYEKKGFASVGQRKKYYDNKTSGKQDALTMKYSQ